MRRAVHVGALFAVVLSLSACGGGARPRTIPPERDGGPPLLYVAVGASESVGLGTEDPLREAWPRILFRTALPASAVFVNLGIPGATVAEALARQVPEAVALEPNLVTVWLNANDLIAGVTAAEYEAGLEKLLRTLRRDGSTRVLVANTPPLDRLPAYLACLPDRPVGSAPCTVGRHVPPPEVLNAAVDAYNDVIARVAERTGATVVDLHAAGLAARRAGTDAELVSRDGFHPSAAGHRAVAEAFAAVLAER